MKRNNFILLADLYKYSHADFADPQTDGLFSYMESRGGMFKNTVWFGTKILLKDHFSAPMFDMSDIEEADDFLRQAFGRDDVFPRKRWERLLEVHGGNLPIRIKAAPEGSFIPVSNALMTIESLDPEFWWVVNFVESLLLQLWYPCSVATLAKHVRGVIDKFYDETASEQSMLQKDLVLNDFGLRGSSSLRSAQIGGAAAMLSTRGSDNAPAGILIQEYYGSNTVWPMSVPATEHMLLTMKGIEGELEMMRRALTTHPTGTIACISDSYQVFHACSVYWGGELRELILSRKEGCLVIRLDSGDPVMTVLKVLSILFDKFGFETNSKGYKVLPPQVRIMQSDGVDYESILAIYGAMKMNKISAENIFFGMGGALLQKVNRDTNKYAFKCSWASIGGEGRDVQKSPVELLGNGELQESFKKSKPGKLKLILDGTVYKTVRLEEFPDKEDQLSTVYENGNVKLDNTFEEAREKLAEYKNFDLTTD